MLLVESRQRSLVCLRERVVLKRMLVQVRDGISEEKGAITSFFSRRPAQIEDEDGARERKRRRLRPRGDGESDHSNDSEDESNADEVPRARAHTHTRTHTHTHTPYT